jgi:TRAP-type C4-dicarboxylate transport system permease small subunit
MTTSPRRLILAARRVSDALHRATCAVCIVLVVFMVTEVLLHVLFRYAFFAPFKWGEELARLVMVWTGMLGIAIALREGEHMGLDTLLERVGPRLRAVLRLGGLALVAMFLLVLLGWGGVMAFAARDSVLPALQISWSWAMAAVPVTALLQLVHVGREMLDALDAIADGPAAGAGGGSAAALERTARPEPGA